MSCMYSIASLLSVAVAFSLVLPVSAIFNASSHINLSAYYGQGPSQPNLLHFCQQANIDMIPLAFVDIFPAQGDGYPGTNFGNRCWGSTYSGPGYNGVINHTLDALQSQCPTLNNDIPLCQSTYGKKILLSLGGSTATYQLSGVTNGQNFADFLWGAFGPRNATWVSQGLPRPFDGPDGTAVEVDGFDFDIEFPSNDTSAGYIALLTRLRAHFASSPKQYLITGAPQCVVPDANMGTMISAVQFDILWIQYYNTGFCSARNWITSPSSSGFSFDAWAAFLVNTASANAKIYIGLPGAPAAANPTFYLSPVEAGKLIEAYFCRNSFGGVMLWDATYADNNVNQNVTYHVAMKNILVTQSQNTSQPCVGNGINSMTSSAQTTSSKSITSTLLSTRSSSSSSTTSSTMLTSQTIYSTMSTSVVSSSKTSTPSSTASSSRSTSSITTSTISSTTLSSNRISTSSSITSTVRTTSSLTSSSKTSATSTATSTTGSNSLNRITSDGTCGHGVTCTGSTYGQCCSQYGWCGTGTAWCGPGCQSAYGMCSTT